MAIFVNSFAFALKATFDGLCLASISNSLQSNKVNAVRRHRDIHAAQTASTLDLLQHHLLDIRIRDTLDSDVETGSILPRQILDL